MGFGDSYQKFSLIQAAIDASQDGMTVWVGPGTYFERNITYRGANVSVKSTEVGNTTVNAEGNGRIFVFNSGETSGAVLDGFILVNGHASGSDSGGGVSIGNSDPTLANLRVEDCVSDKNGGGLFLNGSVSRITNCSLLGNKAMYGGGLGVYDSSPSFSQVAIEENMADYGGGVFIQNSRSTFDHILVKDNEATKSGGGVYEYGAYSHWFSVWMLGNSASHGGGVFACISAPDFIYAVFSGNTIGLETSDCGFGGANFGTTILRMSVVAYNQAGNIQQDSSSASVTLIYSDLYNPSGWKNHNLSFVDPSTLFIEPGFLSFTDGGFPSDVHLAPTSPLIDAGDLYEIDPDGTVVDMGAYAGPDGDKWDLDGDGYPDYFWPGTMDEDAPSGFSPADFDRDDLNASVH